MKKFWVVHNIPSPYRLHIFNALWKECQKRGLDFHVHFMSDMSHGYEERPTSWRNPKMDFPYTYWRDWGVGQHHFNPGFLWHLWREQPEYLLSGSPFDTLTGMFAGWLVKGGSCTWCEGNTKTPGKMGFPLGWVKRFALGGFKYVAVPGKEGVDYIALHQARTKRKMPVAVYLPNLIDEKLFKVREEWDFDKIDELRKENGCSPVTRLCFIPARFVWDKGLKEFFSILEPEMVKGWKILVLGHGPLQAEVEQIVAERGLREYVVIKNSIPYEDVPIYYAASDLFLLPSVHDQNPLSVVEALHSGLAIALSDQAGNVEEAVCENGKLKMENGECGEGVGNGWVLPVKDRGAFEAKLKEVFATPKERLHEMGRISKEVNARFWNTEESIRQFVDVMMLGRDG